MSTTGRPEGNPSPALDLDSIVAAGKAGALPGPPPSVEDLRAFLDLQDRIVGYLEAAAGEWATQQGVKENGGWTLRELDEQDAEFAYYRDHSSFIYNEKAVCRIPLADLHPEYGRSRATLLALQGPR